MPSAQTRDSSVPAGTRLLIVDDDRGILNAYRTSLRRSGFAVTVAENTRDALAALEREPPDVALVDLVMPGSGISAIREIKRARGAAVYVVATSGYDGELSRLAAFDAGADGFILKPVSDAELQRRMAAAARVQQSFAQAQSSCDHSDRLLTHGREASALLAHDLTGALSILQSHLAYLARTSRADLEQEVALAGAQRAATQLAGLVDDFISIGRFEDAALELKREPVELRGLIDEVCRVHAGSARDQVTSTVTTPPGLVVEVDRSLIARVLHNLVGNAFRYCPPAGVVQVTATADRGRFTVAVANPGPPVPPDLVPRLFGKYQKGPGGGLGMGLYFSRLVTEAHCGSIRYQTIDDAPCFEIELPVSARECPRSTGSVQSER